MRKLHTTLFLAALFALVGPAQGQIKLPIYDGDEPQAATKGVSFEPAKDRLDYKHGTLMRVTMKDNRVVKGTLVRADAKAGKLYIRTEAGQLPEAVVINDIKLDGDTPKVDRGVVPVSTDEGKDRPMMKERVVQPEIFTTSVSQGSIQSASYTSTVLSPQEKSYLNELAAAEQEVATLELQTLRRNLALASADAVIARRLETARIYNLAMGQQLSSTYGLVPMPLPLNALAIGTVNDVGTRFAPLGRNLTQVAAFFGNTQPDYSFSAAIAAALPGPQPIILPETSATALADARKRLRMAQSRAIYEDGKIVAVAYEPEDKPKVAPAN